jgi:hypothetical protein
MFFFFFFLSPAHQTLERVLFEHSQCHLSISICPSVSVMLTLRAASLSPSCQHATGKIGLVNQREVGETRVKLKGISGGGGLERLLLRAEEMEGGAGRGTAPGMY